MRGEEYFGNYGGSYLAEILRAPVTELEEAFTEIIDDEIFWEEVVRLGKTYIGRPTPLLHAENATKRLKGARIYIKLEGLANTGAHKINNALGQALLAKKMGKKRIIAETGAGQHGVAVAAVCAKLGIDCTVYMGTVDMRRQRPNVFWMEQYGAKVAPVGSGSATLKDAINEALRDWAGSFRETHYLIGSALGPAPYPRMVREFQSVVGKETAEQLRERGVEAEGLIACVGGGSNAIGFFEPFLDTGDDTKEKKPRLIGVEAGGRGGGAGNHAARMTGEGEVGIVHGYKSRFLLTEDGQVGKTHSISAGLDYPGIGPQLAYLGESGRIEFTVASDEEALSAVSFFARNEGIIFALESAHAGAAAIKLAPKMGPDKALVINMSGRGDKDLFITAGALEPEEWGKFLREEADRYGK